MESFQELQRRQFHIFREFSMFILALKILPFPLDWTEVLVQANSDNHYSKFDKHLFLLALNLWRIEF